VATKFDEWWRRASFPAKASAPLGFGYEYWDLNLARYEGWKQLRERYQTLGRKTTKRGLAYELASHLLGDVLVAAGGVEVAVSRMRIAAAELHAYADEHNMKPAPGVPHGLGHPAATDLWYAFADLVSWTRTVVERLERRAEDPKQFPRQGLIPALRPKRLKRKAEAILNDLRRGPVGKARPIANFMLHTALVAHPFSGVAVDTSGRVMLPVPDPPVHSVKHWYLLTWNQHRDGLEVAEETWEAVQRCVEELLEAFERAVPKRLRR